MLKHYFVRGDILYISFDDVMEAERLILGELKISPKTQIVDGERYYMVLLSMLNAPIDFRSFKYSLSDKRNVNVELIDGLPQIYFSDDDDYDKSGYTWGKNRHPDPETNFFIADQVIKYSGVSMHVKFSLAVMQGYRSLELMNDDLIEKSLRNINALLKRKYDLPKSHSVRKDRHHLFFSINYVLQLIYIYKGSEKELLAVWKDMEIFLREIYSESILRISIINVLNPFIMMALYLFLSDEEKGKKRVVENALSYFKKAVSYFNFPFDPVHFKELSMPQSSMSYMLPLKRVRGKDDELNASIKNHLRVSSLDDYVKKTFYKSLRTKGTVNDLLYTRFMSFDFNSFNDFIGIFAALTPAKSLGSSSNTDLLQELSEKIQITYSGADMLRELAFKYEEIGDYEMALLIMKEAQALRPKGPLIGKKVSQYLEQLGTA